jgi:hypothetical protein
MTSCFANDELLWDYLHDLLDPAQVNQLEEHLATCAACRQALEVAKADCASLAAASRLDGPFPLFEAPAEEAPATIPLRSGWAATTKRWGWAAAAVLLVAFGLPFAGYQMGSVQRSRDVQQAESEVLAKREQRERFRDQIAADQSAATNQLMAKQVRLQVHGPAEIQPDQANVFRVSTTDLIGKPAVTPVTARVTRDNDGAVLFEKKLQSDGDLLVSLPPLELAHGSKASVEFSANSSEGLELVREVLEVHPAPEATHLALEKSRYLPGERILFRSVTLDRASWRPDAKPFAIQYELKGPDNSVVASLAGATHEGGIGGGEFKLPTNAKPGVYKLTAADADGRFAPVTRTLRVANASTTPANLDHFDVFPEGGSLIAGVPTRVYFNARSLNDEPVEVEGSILDSKRQEVGTFQSATLQGKAHLGAGRGFFVFTPKKAESYFLRQKNAADKDPVHALPPVQEIGVGLSLRNPVIRSNEEIGATIFALGEETSVVLGLFARGRMIAQRAVTLHAGANAITLPAPTDFAGVYRVALFSTQPGAQMPLAERLGFCRAERGLPVSWETATRDGKQFLKIKSGAGTPEKSWFAVSVQPADDATSLEHAAGNGLLSTLLLRHELPRCWPEDNAGTLLRDDPATAEALALYLGLQGPKPLLRPNQRDFASGNMVRAGSQSLAMLNMDNLEGVRTKLGGALAMRMASMQEQARSLAESEATAQAQSKAARSELESYQERARDLFKPLLGLLVVSFFAIACVGLTVAIWRMMSHQEGARNLILTACGSVAACLVFVALSSFQFVTPSSTQPSTQLTELQVVVPEFAPVIAMDTKNQRGHLVMNLPAVRSVSPVVPRLTVDRNRPLPVAAVQAKSLWLPAISSPDGSCEVELTVPPGKLGHVLHIDVFTASGHVGTTTALVK